MFARRKKILFVLFFFTAFCFFGQDTLRYRNTIVQASLSDFFLISPTYPAIPRFYPAGTVSLKSYRVDSLYAPLKNFNFVITIGAAASRYLLSDAEVFKNFLDKSPMSIYSKRFWGGFGINYRKAISNKLIFDVDVAPCVEMIVDKSDETRTDTSSWESKGFEDIYEGLHLYTNLKLEYRTQSNYAIFVTVSGSVPLLNRFVDNGDDMYRNIFKGQFFVGIGLTHFYKSKRKVDKDGKPKERD